MSWLASSETTVEAKGRIHPIGKIQFYPSSQDEVRDKIRRWYKEKKVINFHISGEAVITGGEHGALFLSTPEGNLAGNDIVLKTWYKKSTLKQKNTLKALESLIFQVDEGIAPPTSQHLAFIHEGIIQKANIQIFNSFMDTYVTLRTSMPECDTVAMNRFIEIALDELSMRDIDEDLKDSLFNKPLSELFREWYARRSVEDDIDHIADWNAYRLLFPWCEFTFKRGTEDAPLQRMHIVSGGADIAQYEEPWNWIHASPHIHQKQHQYGWEPILQDFPHMKPKIDKARALAKKRELRINGR